MSIDKATIVNQALTVIGCGPTFSIDDNSDLAEQVAAIWPWLVDQTFGVHEWSFAKKTFRNIRHGDAPENGWRFGFDLPGNRIGNPLKIMARVSDSPSPLRNFAIEEGKLYCNEPDTWSVCKVLVDPDYWDPSFRAAFVVALAGYLAVPVWADRDLQDQKLQEAFGPPSMQGTGGMIGRLMAQDKASAPVGEPLLANDPLTGDRGTDFRMGGPWHGGS